MVHFILPFTPFTSRLEFEDIVSNKLYKNKKESIEYLISLAFIENIDNIKFTHKLFKEFFIAKYLIKKLPLNENQEFYLKYVNNDEWVEIFIFLSGLFDDYDRQNEFLDFLMENNLKLYIQCVNDNSVIIDSNEKLAQKEILDRYLKEILYSYSFIVNKYFSSLKSEFPPNKFVKEDVISRTIIKIYGTLSKDGSLLSYQLVREYPNGENVPCTKGCFSQSIDLELYESHFGENLNGRKIAIDSIYSTLKKCIKSHNLLEDEYLMCERLSFSKKKISEIKDISDYDILLEKIRKHTMGYEKDCISFMYNKIDLIQLIALIEYLKSKNIVYNDSIIPSIDVVPNENTKGTVNLYSDARKMEI